jgi:hypothetical protein
MAADPELLAHRQWLGYLQPIGLVVSPPALLQAQAQVNANVAAEHQRFLGFVKDAAVLGHPEPLPAVTDLPGLLREVFGWQPTDLVPADDSRAADLTVALPDYHETLRPTYAVPGEPHRQRPRESAPRPAGAAATGGRGDPRQPPERVRQPRPHHGRSAPVSAGRGLGIHPTQPVRRRL